MQKIASLAEKILKSLVENYKKNQKDTMKWEEILSLFPDEPEKNISTALSFLLEDNFVSIFDCDNVPYLVTLNPSGIAKAQEKVLLKRGYTIIKEIISLLT